MIETSYGTMEAVLYPEQAPLAVENFIFWAEAGYYDGCPFFRIEPDYLAASGDATGSGTNGVSKWDTAFQNEPSDLLHHYSGALVTANYDQGSRGGENTSMFYFVQTPAGKLAGNLKEQLEAKGGRPEILETYLEVGGAPELDGQDTVFGQVYLGMDVLDKMADSYQAQQEAREAGEKPDDTVPAFVINHITITTYGEARAAEAAASSAAES